MVYRRANKISSLTLILAASLSVLSSSGCNRDEPPAQVSLEKTEEVPPVKKFSDEASLRIAVGSMITPREGFAYYRRLLNYVGEKMGRPVTFIARDKYSEVNELLRKGDLDVAFVCSGPYVAGHDRFGLELLAAPQVYGKTVYFSYIIVRSDSPITGLEGLRGKTFAFADPDSNTGKIVPDYLLAVRGETPATYFKKYVFTQGHDMSIRAVADGLVDGAAVDSLVWEYLNRTDPEYTSKTKIVFKSAPYGIPPVVVRPGLDARTKQRLKRIFLDVDKDGEGREILRGMMIDRFVPIEDAAYKSVREMRAFLSARNGPRGKQNP